MEKVEKGLHPVGRVRDVGSDASSTAASHGSTGPLDEFIHAAEQALSLPERPDSRWHRAGISPRAERWLDLAGGILVAVLMIGWTWSIVDAATSDSDRPTPNTMRAMSSALTNADAPTVAYLTDGTLNALSGELRGISGKLRVQMKPAGESLGVSSLPEGAQIQAEVAEDERSTEAPRAGIWKLAVAVGNAIRPITDFNLISLRPLRDKQNGRVGLYYIGNWPGETGKVSTPSKAPPDRYRPPRGFIEVTQQNADTRVSEHFKLRDFLTHDQASVWPKFLVLETRNVDKLELVLADLQAHGHDVHGVKVMSGFRTPQYNKGGGNTGGRAGLSRHMYGDAADIFIDSDGDGVMDDLNHNGRHDIGDARVVSEAVDRVEAAHPELIGGAGVYPAASGHGPFIHIDSRGYRARWIGSGGGS